MNAGETNHPCNQYDSSLVSLYNINLMIHLSNTPDMGMYFNKSVKFMGHKVENKITNTKFSCTKKPGYPSIIIMQTVTESILSGIDAGIYI
jgi:hypothetical protein